MTRKLAAGVATALTLALSLVAPVGGAEAGRPPAHAKPKVLIEPVASPLEWLDTSFGEVPGGVWERVTSVSYKVVGCRPGEYLYWSDGPAYQDGRQLYGVFGGLGQGEATCDSHGTSTSGARLYRDPKSLHPGWLRLSVTFNNQLTGKVLGTSTRWVWIPRAHRSPR